MKPIAYIRTDFPEKFGIPRQSNIVDSLIGRIVFEKEYAQRDAVRGLEGYDYIWLLWQFEGTEKKTWSATVRPPRLGGNERVGVFATRSPFRPNPIGLSSVKLIDIEFTEKEGLVIIVAGADMRDGTPIYDIKPYLPFVDSHPDARAGFTDERVWNTLEVDFKEELLNKIPEDKRTALIEILRQDPRTPNKNDKDHIFGIAFAGKNIRFTVDESRLTVIEVDEYC